VLSGVSCPSTTSCFAVGHYFDGSSTKTLVERWNGTNWSVIASPGSAAFGLDLSRVSCASATSCLTVGFIAGGTVFGALVEQWNGTSWSTVARPHVGDTFSDNILSDVSCLSSTSCYVAGHYSNPASAQAAVEHWDGTKWTVATIPKPAGATDSTFYGLTCRSATNCTAVGHFGTASTARTLIERFNGTSWSIPTSPKPTNSTDSTLSDVACPSATNCYAVGAYNANGSEYTLIERYA
jgi:hypothetical protein